MFFFNKGDVLTSIISKTFLRLRPNYYFKNMAFSVIVTGAFLYLLYTQGLLLSSPPLQWFLLAFNALMYPYSIFLFDSLLSFFMGNKTYQTSASFYFMFRLLAMVICYLFAILISPVGLIHLYARYGKKNSIITQGQI